MTKTPTPLDEGLQALVNRVKGELARRLSIDVDQINLVQINEVAWPDASLGCPQSGMAYAQVITSGFRILLEAHEKIYEFHADKAGFLVFFGEGCRPTFPTIPVKPGEIKDGEPWMPVD